MAATPTPRRLTLALTPSFAIAATAVVALTCLFLPSDVLEVLVLDSGIPAILPAAEPPLGYTARVALAMTAGGAAGALVWLAAYVVLGGDGVVHLARPRLRWPAFKLTAPTIPTLRRALAGGAGDAAAAEPVPVLRRADAHPDAPARAPLIATRDLGAPFLDVRARGATPPPERALPQDLSAPLSAFDPCAIPDTPAVPPPALAPLQPRRIKPDLDPGERFDAFELARPIATQPHNGPIAAPRTDATIHALLDRLERGVTGRGTPVREAKPATIAATLDELRSLAAR